MTRPLRVLHCIHALSGGGAERQLDLLCSHDDPKRVEHTTLYMESGAAQLNPARRLIRHHRQRKLDLDIFRTVGETIDEVKPDLVHAWLPPVMTVPACVMARQRGIPIVTSFRSAKRFRNWLDVIDFCTSWLCGNGVISNTPPDLCSPLYQRLYKRQQGTWIPNAVKVPDMEDTASAQDLQDGLFKVVFVGRIVPEKNWRNMITALSLLPAHTPVRLSICGNGFEYDALEKFIVEKGVGHLVRLEGYVTDVYQRIARSDALLLPSWTEGMPNVVVEAMALSTPTILSDIGATRAIVGDTLCSLMFSPDEPLELAQRLEQLAGDPQLAVTLAHRGEEVAARYSLDRMMAAYGDYYESVLFRAGH